MQEQLTTVLRENTTRLDAYNQLLLKQKDLEEDLANKQKTVVHNRTSLFGYVVFSFIS